MHLQILISSLNLKLADMDNKTKKFSDLVVINQVPSKLDGSVRKEVRENLQWIDIDQKGLSKSRNYALEISNAEIIYLTDDDVVIKDDINKTIIEGFQKNPEYDILAFDFEVVGKPNKFFATTEKEIGYFNSLRLSSVQLALKSEFIEKNELKFDELFGAGSKYSMGEENIFLFDALKKGAKIKYIPKDIIKLHKGESTWFRGFNEKFFFDRGASYWRMFGLIAPVLSLVFCIKKYKLYSKNISLVKAYLLTLKGMKDYYNTSKN